MSGGDEGLPPEGPDAPPAPPIEPALMSGVGAFVTSISSKSAPEIERS